MAGDLIGDTIYYLIGYRYGHSFIRKFGKYVGVTEEKVAKATIIFNKHHEKILIVSKITNGFGLAIAVLITAGMTRLSFVRFFFFNLAGELVWAGLLLSGGYYFGTWYTQIDSWVGRISIGVGLVFVIVLFFQFNRYLSKRAEAIEV